jgi:Kef-type K+ transport system membrane component KefB/predicted transcriptional regulator
VAIHGILLTVGLLLVAGVIGGSLAKIFNLPKLTGYLAAGIAIGSQGFNLLPHHQVDALSMPVNELAMALVLFVLGGQFHFAAIRQHIRPLISMSLGEAAITFSLVTALTWPVLDSIGGAVLLGVMAVAVAPATTVEVLREYRAEGPVSDGLRLLCALSNVWAILFFEIALLVLFALSGFDASPWDAAWDVIGALLFGLMAGHVLILMQERIGRGNYSVALLTTLLLTIGVCQATGVPHMLAMLVTGAVVVNRSRFFEPVVASMDHFAQPAYVAFFVLSGMHLDFRVLVDNWVAASLYVLARVIGKVVGARVALRASKNAIPGLEANGGPPIGLGLLCQAGAAIALATLAKEYDEELGKQLLTIVLGAVVVFELLGPLFVRYVAIAAGEVRISELMKGGQREKEKLPWFRLVTRALRGRDIAAPGMTLDDLEVAQIMRRSPRVLDATASLDEVLRFANQSPFNQFPVVGEGDVLIGVIALQDLEQVTFDRRVAGLVIARDLVSAEPLQCSLAQSASLAEAVAFFQDYEPNTAAVVLDRDRGTLVGMIERAEVLGVVRSIQAKTASRAASLAQK